MAYKAAKKNWNALGQGISLITAQIQGSLEQTRMPVRRRARSTNPRASAHILGKHCKQGKIGRKNAMLYEQWNRMQ